MHISKKYKWMARDSDGELYVCMKKPTKLRSGWNFGGGFAEIFAYNHMFGPIRWEDDEPTLIKDIYDPQIISDAERGYLKTILKPFRNEVEYIEKSVEYIEDHSISGGCCMKEYLFIKLRGGAFIFPSFNPGEMYSGMKPKKKYSTDELGITYTEGK